MNTLLLDTVQWDLLIDGAANIAMASEPYSLAQDAASAVRTFQGECYYDTTLGVPYWANILGQAPPLSLIKSYIISAAMTVPDVVAAACFISSFTHRTVTGQVQVTNASGKIMTAGF
jgi:hypothetical protein